MLNNKHHYDSAQANNAHNHSALRGVTTSQSDSAIDELAHSNYYGGGNTSTAQVKATHSRPQLRNNNYMSSIATDQDDDLVEAEELPYHTDSAPSATTTTTTRLPQLSPHGTPPKKASFYYTDYEESAPEGAAAEETAGECTEYADPIEVFTYLDIEWKVYVTEENEVYYLDMGNEHSQWEDPREHGIIYHLEGGPAESPSGKFSEPPKSPSPKALEKSGGGRYGGGGSGAGNSFHFRQLEGEESPRVRDIKPIKLKWEVGDDDGCAADEGKLGSGDSFAVRSGKNRRLNMRHRKAAASEFSSDSSDDEIKSAVQVRYPRCRQQQQQQQISLIDAEEQGGSGCAIDNTAVLRTGNISPVGTIDLAEIHVTEKLENIENDTEDPSPADSPVENLQPVGKRNNNESRDSKAEEGAVPLFQRSNSDVPFESAEQLERGRIKLLAQEFNKAGGKPLSPVTSFHGASRSLAAAFALRDARAAAENGTTSGKETEAAHVNVSKPDSKPIAPIKESASARSVAPTPSASTGTSAATSTVASTSNVASTSSSGSVTISREEAEMYVQLIVSGKSLQEVGEIMDRDVCSQQFKLQVLAWADEATILTVPSLSADSFSSPSSGPNENAIAPEAAPVVVAQETIAMLKEDPVLMKYAKMLSMGVPPGNVLMKLKMENVEVSQRNRLMRAAGQEEEVDPNSSSAVPFAPAPAGAAMVRRPSANMQNLHWNTLPADKLKHSIWSQATGNAVNDIAETDLLELERLFGAQKDGGKGGSFATTRTLGALAHSQKEALQLFYLDKKRAQNIVIGLNPFKSLGTHVEILKALCSLNDIGGKITADHIDNFRNLLPTAEELKRIDKINGSKHPAELFFQAVMVFYPELPVRLNCFAACLNFNTNCEAVLARTKKLVNACNQVPQLC